jgi:iron-sulfur cluster insertion protein
MASQSPPPLSLSASAVKRLADLVMLEGKPNLMLRVSVAGGGCAGFQYSFSFDEAVTGDDVVIDRDGVRAVIDNMSLMYLLGSEIDFVESLSGSAFSIRNPNATSSCGCGTSFAI